MVAVNAAMKSGLKELQVGMGIDEYHSSSECRDEKRTESTSEITYEEILIA